MRAITHQKCSKGPSLILSSANESCQLQMSRWEILPNHRPCPLTDNKKPSCGGSTLTKCQKSLSFQIVH